MHNIYSGKKINLTIQFENNITQCEIDPFENISSLLSLILKLYQDISIDQFEVIYQNKVIDFDNEVTIGDFIKRKKEMTIEIKKRNKTIFKADEVKRCQCTDKKITSYCSLCNMMLCNECKKNHNNHKIINVNIDNIEESVKLYSISLQADISNELNKYKTIENLFKDLFSINFKEWKQQIYQKIDSLESVYNKFKDLYHCYQDKYAIMEQTAIDTTLKIDKILEEMSFKLFAKHTTAKNTRNKEFILKGYKALCSLSRNEDIINQMKNDVLSRNEQYKNSKKINDLFTKINNLLENIVSSSEEKYTLITLRNNNKRNITSSSNHKTVALTPKVSLDRESIKKIKRYTTDLDVEESILDSAIKRKQFKISSNNLHYSNKRTQNLTMSNRVHTSIQNKTSNNRITIVLPSLK